MIVINCIIDNIIKKKDISCNNINIFYLQSLGYSSDIKIYKECIIDNEYMFDEESGIIENLYFESKKIKNKLVSFVKKWKWKKAIISSVDTDLYLNKLDTFKNIYKIILLENNTKYIFRLSDLINYWIESLQNSQGLFSKPLILKNPHTNLEFSKHNLYNIYFKLLYTGFNIPTIISNFFYSNMDTKIFSYKYYPVLKETAIMTFVDSSFLFEQWEQILNMLHDFRKDIDYITFTNTTTHRIKIKTWKNIKHIVKSYLCYKYSCNPLVVRDSKSKTKKLLLKYLEDFPDFGYSRDVEIMRFVPYDERRRRRRTNPPAPPPILITNPPPPPQTPINSIPLNPPPIAPPNPPIAHIPSVPQINTTQNPFQPSRQIPRTPNSITTRGRLLSNNLSLFRR